MTTEHVHVHPCARSVRVDDRTTDAANVRYCIVYQHQVRQGVCVVCHEYVPGTFYFDHEVLDNLKKQVTFNG